MPCICNNDDTKNVLHSFCINLKGAKVKCEYKISVQMQAGNKLYEIPYRCNFIYRADDVCQFVNYQSTHSLPKEKR